MCFLDRLDTQFAPLTPMTPKEGITLNSLLISKANSPLVDTDVNFDRESPPRHVSRVFRKRIRDNLKVSSSSRGVQGYEEAFVPVVIVKRTKSALIPLCQSNLYYRQNLGPGKHWWI